VATQNGHIKNTRPISLKIALYPVFHCQSNQCWHYEDYSFP